MDKLLNDDVALITGGSRGIGLAIAEDFLANGCKVVIASRKAKSEVPNYFLENPRVLVANVNVGNHEAIDELFKTTIAQFGKLTILVNNAATNPYFGPLTNIDMDRFRKTIEINLVSVVKLIKSFVDCPPTSSARSILNIASIGGLRPEPNIGAYNLTKAALIHMTQQLALELSPQLRVNAIAPGLVKTEFARALWEGNEKKLEKNIPMKRIGNPSDIANLATFLSSKKANYITGGVFVVDGGSLVAPGGTINA